MTTPLDPPSPNGVPVPVLDGLPISSKPGVWAWNIYRVGRTDGEEVWLCRFSHDTGITELWAPASFWKEFAEKVALQMSGLYIARPGDAPPPPEGHGG